MAELIDTGDDYERERRRLVLLGLMTDRRIDVDELSVRRALVLDAAGMEPAGHMERLAAELGVTAEELHAWLVYRHEGSIRP